MRRTKGTPAGSWFYGQSFHSSALSIPKTREYVKRLTFDTVTGKIVEREQSESFDGRFVTMDCKWNGNEWVPMNE